MPFNQATYVTRPTNRTITAFVCSYMGLVCLSFLKFLQVFPSLFKSVSLFLISVSSCRVKCFFIFSKSATSRDQGRPRATRLKKMSLAISVRACQVHRWTCPWVEIQVSMTTRPHAIRQRNRTMQSRERSSQRSMYPRSLWVNAPANHTWFGIATGGKQ